MPESYTGPGLFKRFLLGSLLIVASAASATSVAAFHEVDKVVEALRTGETLQLGGYLAEAEAGTPRTILLLGHDRRESGHADPLADTSRGRSDTIILVRLDPSKQATAMMTLPRDLKVDIPGRGTDRLNAAYSFGGTKLALRTIKRLTGLRINHVITVDFKGFWEGVDRIGCVYTDVDRRYFNQDPQFAPIDIEPGYRRLCGGDALAFVRYRHEDHDLVRGARQMEFLRQAKQQVGAEKLFDDRDKLVKIFGKYTRSDIDDRKTVLSLLKLAVFSAGRPVREVHFEGQIGPSYVTASDSKVQELVQQFLGLVETPGPRGRLRPRGKRRKRATDLELGLEGAADAGREQALQAVAAGVRFPIYYPRKRTRGALFAGQPTYYALRDSGGKLHYAYRMVTKRGPVGEYYGLQGMTWKDPPILKDSGEKRRSRGREYEIFRDGDRVRLVAWRTPEAVYWVSNTLLLSLSSKQMMAIARSARTL